MDIYIYICMYILRTHIYTHNRGIQKDLEAIIPVRAPKLGAQRRFLVQYILSSILSDKCAGSLCVKEAYNYTLKSTSNSNLGQIFEKNTLN